MSETIVAAGKNPQYGFAHRVNDWDVIVDVLDAGTGGGKVAGNGIECDIGWSTFYDDWIVSHDSFASPSPRPNTSMSGLEN